MKTVIAVVTAAILAGEAYAGCGVKIDVEGELTKYDEETKEVTVGRNKVTLLASAIRGGTKIEDMIGKTVVVSTDKHTKKGESLTIKESDESATVPADKPKEMKSNLLAENQDWTNSEGVTINAAVQKVEKGKVYFLKDGRVIPYDVSKLSKETIDKLKAIVAAQKQ